MKKTFRFERAGRLYEVSVERSGKSVVLYGKVVNRDGSSCEIGRLSATADVIGDLYKITMNGTTWTGTAVKIGTDVYACGAGRTARLALVPEGAAVKAGLPASRRQSGQAGVKSFDPVLKAPITGKVVKIPVKAGVKIDAGSVIVVMDAMKMEFQLKASHDSIVKKLLVVPGQQVELGQPIAELGSLK